MSTRLSDLQQYVTFMHGNQVVRLDLPPMVEGQDGWHINGHPVEPLTVTVPAFGETAESVTDQSMYFLPDLSSAIDRELDSLKMTLERAVEVLNEHKYLNCNWVAGYKHATNKQGDMYRPFEVCAIAEKLEREAR